MKYTLVSLLRKYLLLPLINNQKYYKVTTVPINNLQEAEDILIISEQGQVTRTSLAELRILSRRTQGVSIVNMEEKDKTVSIASMDPILRNARDTQPKAAKGKEAALETTLQNSGIDEDGEIYNNDVSVEESEE